MKISPIYAKFCAYQKTQKVMLRRLHKALTLLNAANAAGNNTSEINFN